MLSSVFQGGTTQAWLVQVDEVEAHLLDGFHFLL